MTNVIVENRNQVNIAIKETISHQEFLNNFTALPYLIVLVLVYILSLLKYEIVFSHFL
nr:MAG TPA: hypothetical protein [Caudoviricetes sp.]